MFNYIWAGMILFAIILSFFNGTAAKVSAAAANGSAEAVKMCVELIGVMAFWNGIMNIAKKGGIVDKTAKFLKPIFKKVFKKVSPDSDTGKNMLMNITANILGLGNAATPFGLSAMKDLGKAANGTATDDMIMFLIFNTASIQLIPTTVISLRTAASSASPSEIIVPVWIVSAVALTAGIIAARRMK